MLTSVCQASCEAVRLCSAVANITVSVTDDVYRAARVHAAQRGSSVSALVSSYLSSLSDQDAEFSRLEAQQRRVQSQIQSFSRRSPDA
jgi:hypothetical protein